MKLREQHTIAAFRLRACRGRVLCWSIVELVALRSKYHRQLQEPQKLRQTLGK